MVNQGDTLKLKYDFPDQGNSLLVGAWANWRTEKILGKNIEQRKRILESLLRSKVNVHLNPQSAERRGTEKTNRAMDEIQTINGFYIINNHD